MTATTKSPVIHTFADTAQTAEALADWIFHQATASIADHGYFAWALSGGHSPRALFEHLVTPEIQRRWPWSDILLYWGDERDVPVYHQDSNFGQAYDALIRHLVPPPRNVFRWWTVVAPALGLSKYREALARLQRDEEYPVLDLVLLGLGPDGHTASLFPGSPQLHSTDWVAYGPGPLAFRYSLTLPTINHARQIAFLVTGRDKAPIVRTVITQGGDFPAQYIRSDRTAWFLDFAAASQLSMEEH